MIKTILCTVSDDRSGRKGAMYEATQRKVWQIMSNNDLFNSQNHWNIDNVICSTNIKTEKFYVENKAMLDSIDPAINGRLYKPFAISESLKAINYGDYLIYNDVSPEMWKMQDDFIIDSETHSLEVIRDLCRWANDFLVAFVKWSPDDFKTVPLGIHTHHYFTLESCIKEMKAEKYRHSFQCASGMICIRKTQNTVNIVEDWLEWNKNWLCASIGNPAKPGDESLWHGREDYKLGGRSDQSIISILLNKLNWNYVDIVYNDISPYNFLNFCRKDHDYKFINSNQ